MRSWLLLTLALTVQAEEPAPIGMVRGDLLEWDAAQPAGEFSIRTAENRVFRFTFDPKTYIERERQRIAMGGLKSGDALEIVSDRGPIAGVRYARIVHVIVLRPPMRAPVSLGRLRVYQSPTEHIAPRGDLTFAGVILRLNDERLVLRTRIDGEKLILLRQDTRFLEGGSQVDSSMLKANTRVFVRAGRNLENEIEAYQVVWGAIMGPNHEY